MDLKYKHEYAYCIVSLIFRHIESCVSEILKTECVKSLTQEDILLIIKEFFRFDLYICDKLLFLWFGDPTRNNLFDEIEMMLFMALTQGREKILDEKLNLINTTGDFAEYLKILRNDNFSYEWFVDEYNQRVNDYKKYRFETENEQYEGWLFWEFGKKISFMIGHDRQASFIVPFMFIAMNFLKKMNLAKTVIFDKNYDNEQP